MDTIADPKLKILIEGKHLSGKTCLFVRYTQNIFQTTRPFLDFYSKKIIFNNISHIFQIFDIQGNRKFPVPPIFYRNVSGIIFTVDSENDIENQFNIIRANVGKVVPIILACTKRDLLPPKINNEELEKFAKEKKIKLVFCSSKTGFGVEEVFSNLISEIFCANDILKEKEFESSKQKLSTFLNMPKIWSCF